MAPLRWAGLLRNRLFAERTVALTSATLALGGSFAPLATQWGLTLPAGGTTPGPPIMGELRAPHTPGR